MTRWKDDSGSNIRLNLPRRVSRKLTPCLLITRHSGWERTSITLYWSWRGQMHEFWLRPSISLGKHRNLTKEREREEHEQEVINSIDWDNEHEGGCQGDV